MSQERGYTTVKYDRQRAPLRDSLQKKLNPLLLPVSNEARGVLILDEGMIFPEEAVPVIDMLYERRYKVITMLPYNPNAPETTEEGINDWLQAYCLENGVKDTHQLIDYILKVFPTTMFAMHSAGTILAINYRAQTSFEDTITDLYNITILLDDSMPIDQVNATRLQMKQDFPELKL